MTISETLSRDFASFLACVPAKRLKKNTLTILLYYFQSHEGPPGFLDEITTDIRHLFELLDSIDDEVDQSHLV